MSKKVCSKCNVNPIQPFKRYCKECHAAYMKEWRKQDKESARGQLRKIMRLLEDHKQQAYDRLHLNNDDYSRAVHYALVEFEADAQKILKNV